MKCHFCHSNLTPLPYNEWKINERRCVEYQCTNSGCTPFGNGRRIILNVILPDMEVQYYSILFQHKEQWYRITGVGNETSLVSVTMSSGMNDRRFIDGHETNIISIDRFCPINAQEDFGKQAARLFEKLKSLNTFS